MNPLRERFSGKGYDPNEVVKWVEEFDFDKLNDSKGTSLKIRPLHGRFAVETPSDTKTYTFDTELFNVPKFYWPALKYQSGYLIQFVVNLEFRLNF